MESLFRDRMFDHLGKRGSLRGHHVFGDSKSAGEAPQNPSEQGPGDRSTAHNPRSMWSWSFGSIGKEEDFEEEFDEKAKGRDYSEYKRGGTKI
jgi:hypothetical protein